MSKLNSKKDGYEKLNSILRKLETDFEKMKVAKKAKRKLPQD